MKVIRYTDRQGNLSAVAATAILAVYQDVPAGYVTTLKLDDTRGHEVQLHESETVEDIRDQFEVRPNSDAVPVLRFTDLYGNMAFIPANRFARVSRDETSGVTYIEVSGSRERFATKDIPLDIITRLELP